MSVIAKLSRSYKFVLVSKSPRRRQLLHQLGLKFSIAPQDTPEKIRNSHFKEDILKVTYEKLDACPARNNSILIACDTIVVCAGKVYGKPNGQDEARRFLKILSNNTHTVYSAVAIKIIKNSSASCYHKVEATDVVFRNIEPDEIEAYIRTKEPYDKAGGYAIQNTGNIFVKRINGCYYNVMGMPITAFLELLKKIKE